MLVLSDFCITSGADTSFLDRPAFMHYSINKEKIHIISCHALKILWISTKRKYNHLIF